ncbi:hypothetical protein E3Q23_02346 [Wallemia mellicola]|uniref:General substrate transporter n=1 Tax=Wallemia mellicola TaxID=1708541 RepID=A0A4T0TIS7_9BASI|nr:hypothetical protein E3Q23_02346 [Wallemia mellicola]TIC64746.1 general substrate transporter [Wallemia mellicola]
MGIKLNNQPVGRTSIFVALLASVGGMMFGANFLPNPNARFSGQARLTMYRFADIRTHCDIDGHNCEEYEFTKVREGLIVALLSIGTMFGSLFGAPFADMMGRKMAMSIDCLVFSIGIIVQITSEHVWQQFAVGRLIAGLGIGALSAIIPIYVSECVVAAFRGTAVACYQLMVTLGILLAYVFSYGTRPLSGSASWRIVVGLALALSLILGIGLWTLPESPRWLVRRKRFDEAKHALARIRGAKSEFEGTVVEHDFLDIASKMEMEEQTKSSFWQSWAECFVGTPATHKLVYRTFVGVMLQSFQQLTGANYFFYYGATIFKSVGIQDSFVTQIILGAVNFFCTFFGLYVMEKFGRRNPLVFGGFWQGAWLVVFAAAGTAKDPTPTEEIPNGRPQIGYLMIVSACLFIASFASTYGPGSWIITGETFPMSHRARQASIATASNWVWNFLISFFSPFIAGDIGFAYGFVFAGCNFFLGAFIYLFLYETAGLSLEAVDEMYSTKRLKPWQSTSWAPEGYNHRRDLMESSKLDSYHVEDSSKEKKDDNQKRFIDETV